MNLFGRVSGQVKGFNFSDKIEIFMKKGIKSDKSPKITFTCVIVLLFPSCICTLPRRDH